MKKSYLYVERWPNNRAYIGQTKSPNFRHKRHVNGYGSKSIKKEIAAQRGILPEMIILAIFDLNIKYDIENGRKITYEQVITLTAERASWNLIYKDMLRPLPRELCVIGGRKAGRMKTPAQQRARRENGRKNGRKSGAANLKKIPRKTLVENGRRNGRKSGATNLKKIPRKILVENGRKSGKLSEYEVREIRSRLASGDSCTSIARDYPVTCTTISNIKNRHLYIWVK